MKLSKLIENAAVIMERYKKKYPEVDEPMIFGIDEDDGALICAKVEKEGSIRRAKKPYMYVKLGLEKLL